MALQKQPVSINFAQGLDTKSDPYQIPIGKFSQMQNSVFDKAGRLTKRNGFANITNLPNALQTNLNTLNNNLLATGSDLFAYSQDTNQWIDKGSIQPVQLETLPLVRVSTSQTGADTAVAPSGLTCLVYMDNSVGYYQISDSSTGQQVVSRVSLGATSTNPRVFIFSQYFVITFMQTVAAAPHLRYIAIPYASPTMPFAVRDLATTVTSITTGYDAYSIGAGLFYAWSESGSVIGFAKLTLSNIALNQTPTPVTITSHTSSLMSVTVDPTGLAGAPVIWVTFWDSSSTNGFTAAYDSNLVQILAPTQIITSLTINRLTSVAAGQVLTAFYETVNVYGYDSNIESDFISSITVSQAGVVGSPAVVLRSVGIASKPFFNGSVIYMLAVYADVNTSTGAVSNEPTYFLIDSHGNIYMRLAATNAGGYPNTQVVPSVTLQNSKFLVPYLIKDFLATVNKTTPAPAGNVSSIYTQTGVNLAMFTINNSHQYSAEIAGALHLTGGQLWEFDGVRPVEHGFQVFPEFVEATTSTGAGGITADTYYYQFTYEWTDNAGNLHRSAPSLPVAITTTTSSSTNTLHVPTLRLTYKIAPNPVRIVGYRWSVGQPVYYQFTSVTSPVLNDPSADAVTITDTASNTSILGQTLLYTTGGVIENIAAPASVASALFKSRLFLVDAEDRNLLWYSKQVIEAVPVEMSDLFTIYVAPTSGAQGSTGPTTALSAMDDKLIIFKSDAIYYLTGTGPDNTGSNNDFSDPTYITSSVGCSNPDSIVLMPNGIMFESDKGIWLLGRDLSTNYIGAPVEAFNAQTVKSATAIPGTNQVRFILNNGITLMYDYYYQQWGTFSNLYAISATLYNGAHTYLNSFGQVYQEMPGTYLDGSSPVLMSFQTSWINLAGLQGYERFYFANLLGTYYTPFKLNIQFAYDYSLSASQSVVVIPDNYTPNWGGDPVWGASTPWGGPGNVFTARIFPEKQKCESFQLTVNELYDASFGIPSGQGLTLSGLNMIAGIKKGYRTQSAAKSFG